MPAKQRFLVLGLRFFGITSLSALYAVVQPHAWMVSTHEWLGLGEFPEAPIASYLARSLSALYALLGGLLILSSTDLKRYRPVLVYLSTAITIFGVCLFFIDRGAGLPLSWTLWEGPFVLALGLVLRWLVADIPQVESPC